MDSEFDPRRSDVHARPLADRMTGTSGSDDPGSTASGTVLSRDELLHWTPVVRRHAMRIADKCRQAVDVGELTEVGLTGLLEAATVAGRVAPDVDRGRYLELAVLGAMRSHLLALRAAEDAARRQSEAVLRALGALGPRRTVLRVARSAIVDELGWTLHAYERALLAIAQAGLARVELPSSAERRDVHPPGQDEVVPFAEALAGLSHDDRALVALVYGDALDLPTAAVRLGRSPREVTVDHVEIVHRLRAVLE